MSYSGVDLHPLTPWQPGWTLARPVRSANGHPLAPAGTPLSHELAERLRAAGHSAVPVIRTGSVLPRLPEHIDRYGPDAEADLVAIFTPVLNEPLMATLLIAATAHARQRQGLPEVAG